MYTRMADAAQPGNIPPGFDIVAGYIGGPRAFHVWSPQDWLRFPGFKLPIWVGGENGPYEGQAAADAMAGLEIPLGSLLALDMETRIDALYVQNFNSQIVSAGYRLWVYGSASTVFRNPAENGYWVADYTSDLLVIDEILQLAHVRAVQFAADLSPGFDKSLVKEWTEGEMWR